MYKHAFANVHDRGHLPILNDLVEEEEKVMSEPKPRMFQKFVRDAVIPTSLGCGKGIKSLLQLWEGERRANLTLKLSWKKRGRARVENLLQVLHTEGDLVRLIITKKDRMPLAFEYFTKVTKDCVLYLILLKYNLITLVSSTYLTSRFNLRFEKSPKLLSRGVLAKNFASQFTPPFQLEVTNKAFYFSLQGC